MPREKENTIPLVRFVILRILTVLSVLAFYTTGCGKSSNSTMVTIGGTVEGLDGILVVTNNGTDSLTIEDNGAFSFSSQVAPGSEYLVEVAQQPTGQTCTISGEQGVAEGAEINSVSILCEDTLDYSIGGTVSGLKGSLTLKNNDSDDLTVSTNGKFTFETTYQNSAEYLVTVANKPSSQNCTVTNGAGTISGESVSNITVTCIDQQISIGGTVSGLSGTLVLQLNGGNNITITANGAFTFNSGINNGDSYSVTVLTPPATQDCQINSSSGTATSNISNISVSCSNFKIIRVSTTTTNGDFGATASLAVTAADGICVTDFGAGYKALIGSSVRNTTSDWPLRANTTYTRPDSTLVAKTGSDATFTFPLSNPISAAAAGVWTGLDDGWVVGQNCSDWTSSAGSGSNGYAQNADSSGILGNGFGCHLVPRLICVQQ